MAEFDSATLSSLGGSQEVDIRPPGAESAVPIWTVRVGNEIFVRSYRGEAGRWYQAVKAAARASVGYEGGEIEVAVEPVSGETLNEAVNAQYLAKYRTSSAVQAMVSPEVEATTLRLGPPAAG